MKVDWGSINWTEKDRYIIKNYKNMTYKTITGVPDGNKRGPPPGTGKLGTGYKPHKRN